jgi:hypothetical protein
MTRQTTKRPTHRVYAVTQRDDKAFPRRLAVAARNRNVADAQSRAVSDAD